VDDRERTLRRAAELSITFLGELGERHVGARTDGNAIAAALGGPLPEDGEDPVAVIEDMAQRVDPGLVATAGPRYFGFVIGGAIPAAVGADWLTAAWDQNANLHALSPAAAGAELVAGAWMLDLLGLPASASVGLPTGAGLANAVGLAAGRHAVLAREGWDVEARGLYGAPEITVVVGEEAHATVLTSLQYLGLGRERVVKIPADEQGQMRADALAEVVARLTGPLLVVAQAGNVNTGGFDPMPAIADAVGGHPNTWIHVDGAFGLWAVVSPRLRHLVSGVERADSWATDAHKWLNLGYDCGFVAVRDSEAHRAAMSTFASYLMQDRAQREPWEYVLDSSRRARGFALYAAVRSLGRSGVRNLVERCCDLARHMADRLAAADGVEVLNDVVLNQVLARFSPADGSADQEAADAMTRDVIRRVQDEGVAWMGGTTWHGVAAMRISVSSWATTAADADRTVDAILRAAEAARASV
jgi:glutamate/tyrosine decarboxylase-like PLP-dependent enzyme